jgi:carbon-monoxide dehydrogenase medium subunit
LAGGTDLLVRLRAGTERPAVLVDIKKISETRAIVADAAGYRIGAAVALAELSEHAALKRFWPGVAEAAALIGSAQIQGRASLGGNLCNASPAADSVPALMAARAICTIAGPGGRREVPAEKVSLGPGRSCLNEDEILVSIFLPFPPPHFGDAYLRFIPRTEMDIAVVGAGISVSLDRNGICDRARVALGAVAPTAILVPEAADALIGTSLDSAALESLAAAARAACRPIDDKRGSASYRTKVAGVLARRAAQIAFSRARSAP